MKHAQASEAEICTIRRSQNHVVLTIRDNGCGIASGLDNSEDPRSGFGLIGMGERARLLGGEFTIQSEPGWGTVATLVIIGGENKLG
ncbi:MAG: ATP-binding protein [Acidobacteriota bacterium]|nr:ATP-binding protein [Acidobacteriota bacterium]